MDRRSDMTPHIPKAEITGLYGYALKRFSRKLPGEVRSTT
jgi:hypothetical protein